MNGNSFLLDTNILLYLVGNKLKTVDLPDGEFYISFITELEVLSYPSIEAEEENNLRELLSEMPIIDIDREIKDRAIEFRKKYNLRLPDAIIAATAFVLNAALITNDKGFSSVKEIRTKPIGFRD